MSARETWMRTLLAAVTGALILGAIMVQSHASTRDIYPAPERAHADLTAALQSAADTHRHVLVDFGGNWCTDCHVLDFYFHDASNQAVLEANFVVVHINVGRMTENLDLAERFHIPIRKGVPALAVLDESGRVLYSQSSGEFQDMRHMQPSAVTEFLTRWGAARR